MLKESWKWLVTVCKVGRWWSARESLRWWQNFQIVYQRCTIPLQTVMGLEIEKVPELQSSLEEINPAIWLSLTALKMISPSPLFKSCATHCLSIYCPVRYRWKELDKLTNFHSSGWEMLRGSTSKLSVQRLERCPEPGQGVPVHCTCGASTTLGGGASWCRSVLESTSDLPDLWSICFWVRRETC